LARNPIGAVILFALGLVLVVPAAVAMGWLGLAWAGHTWARESALWLLQQIVFPLPFAIAPTQLLEEMIRPERIWPRNALATGAVLGLGALFFKAARTAMRPVNQSEDGLADLELETPRPRAGHPIEGRLRILKKSEPGETFRLTLRCSKTEFRENDDSRTETAFNEELTVAAVQDANGLSVPFRFLIPVTAPASGRFNEGFNWRLKVWRTKAWTSFDRGFDLRVAGATPEELAAARPAPSPEEVRQMNEDLDKTMASLAEVKTAFSNVFRWIFMCALILMGIVGIFLAVREMIRGWTPV